MTCEEVRLSLGAHALGALEPDEALEIDMHLATCEVCGAELLELEGVSAFLGKVSEHDVELVAAPPRAVLDRLLNARAKRNRRGRVLLAVAASAAVIAVGGTIWTTVQHNAPQESSSKAGAAAPDTVAPYARAEPRPSSSSSSADAELKLAEPTAPGREFPGENEAKDYYAAVVAFPQHGRTQLNVSVKGIPFGTTCSLVVYGKNGQKDTTDAWTVDRQTYVDKTVFARETRIPLDKIARFAVVDANGKTLVKIPRT